VRYTDYAIKRSVPSKNQIYSALTPALSYRKGSVWVAKPYHMPLQL